MHMKKVRFVSWDWNEALPGEVLANAVNQFEGGPIYAAVVDAGGAERILALSPWPLSPAAALDLWTSPDEP